MLTLVEEGDWGGGGAENTHTYLRPSTLNNDSTAIESAETFEIFS